MERSVLNEIMGSLDNYQSVQAYHSVFEAYYNAFVEYNTDGGNDEVIDMLKRRLFLPLNLSSNTDGVLVVGANPSFDEQNDRRENFMKTTKELYYKPEGHWKEVKELACVVPEHPGAYLDLFPIKQTSLGEFEKIFRTHSDIRAKMLQVTHERLLAIHPKVIISLFAMTSYYWGFKPDATDFCNEKNPWMGYKFKKIEAVGLDAYKIFGWTDNDKVILENDPAKRLTNEPIIIFNTKAWDKQIRQKKMVTPEKLIRLLHDLHIDL